MRALVQKALGGKTAKSKSNAPTLQYVYKVIGVEKFHDGDTFWLWVDVGFRGRLLIDCRIDGFDCPELNPTVASYSGAQWDGKDKAALVAREKDAAARATTFTTNWLNDAIAAGDLWIQSEPDPDDFGRWLGRVFTSIDSLGDHLHALGLASVWPDRWRNVYNTGA